MPPSSFRDNIDTRGHKKARKSLNKAVGPKDPPPPPGYYLDPIPQKKLISTQGWGEGGGGGVQASGLSGKKNKIGEKSRNFVFFALFHASILTF